MRWCASSSTSSSSSSSSSLHGIVDRWQPGTTLTCPRSTGGGGGEETGAAPVITIHSVQVRKRRVSNLEDEKEVLKKGNSQEKKNKFSLSRQFGASVMGFFSFFLSFSFSKTPCRRWAWRGRIDRPIAEGIDPSWRWTSKRGVSCWSPLGRLYR